MSIKARYRFILKQEATTATGQISSAGVSRGLQEVYKKLIALLTEKL